MSGSGGSAALTFINSLWLKDSDLAKKSILNCKSTSDQNSSLHDLIVFKKDLKKYYNELNGNDVLNFTGIIDGKLNNFTAKNLNLSSNKGLNCGTTFANKINNDPTDMNNSMAG